MLLPFFHRFIRYISKLNILKFIYLLIPAFYTKPDSHAFKLIDILS